MVAMGKGRTPASSPDFFVKIICGGSYFADFAAPRRVSVYVVFLSQDSPSVWQKELVALVLPTLLTIIAAEVK